MGELESQGLFIMLTEEARRDRQRRLDLGDKSAALNVQQAAGTAAALFQQMASNAGVSAAKYPAGAPAAMTGQWGGARPQMQMGGVPNLNQLQGGVVPGGMMNSGVMRPS